MSTYFEPKKRDGYISIDQSVKTTTRRDHVGTENKVQQFKLNTKTHRDYTNDEYVIIQDNKRL